MRKKFEKTSSTHKEAWVSEGVFQGAIVDFSRRSIPALASYCAAL